MATNIRSAPKVIGPDGGLLTLANIPARSTRRWVARHKAEIVAAVNGGILSLDEACERYALSAEEFASWQRAAGRFGLSGLRANRLRLRRDD
jgi:hypothetical protein